MKMMLLCGVTAACAAALSGAPACAATAIPSNTPTTVNGIEAVCTGIGTDAQRDPRWAAYPLRIEFAGPHGEFEADADATVMHDGKEVVSVHCGDAWVLVKVPPGRYHIIGAQEDKTATTDAIAPASGQARAILRFGVPAASKKPKP